MVEEVGSLVGGIIVSMLFLHVLIAFLSFLYWLYTSVVMFIMKALHGFGICYWRYDRNPYVRTCHICTREQNVFSQVGINPFGKIIEVDRWEDV